MQFYCRMVSTTVIMLYWFRVMAHKYKKVSKRAQFLHYRCTLRERIEIIFISLTMVMVKNMSLSIHEDAWNAFPICFI